MRKLLAKAALLLSLVFVLLPAAPALAAEAGEGDQRVFDGASLFSASQVEKLETKIAKMRDKIKMDLVVVTTKDAGGKSAMAYADDYYDENGFGVGRNYDGVLFLIDMDNREAYISTSGKMIDYLTDDRIEDILDNAYGGLTSQNYYKAADSFLDGVQVCINDGIPKNQHRYDTQTGKITRVRYTSPLWLLLFFGISAAVGGGCCWFVVGRYRMRVPAYTYPFREKGTLQLSRKEDRYLHQTVTQRRIQTSSSGSGSSGRSSVHRSSSGRSHGGGGRRF